MLQKSLKSTGFSKQWIFERQKMVKIDENRENAVQKLDFSVLLVENQNFFWAQTYSMGPKSASEGFNPTLSL